MQKQNGHTNGTNGHVAPQLQAQHTVGISGTGYSTACNIAAATGASIAAVVSAAMERYATALTDEDIQKLALENRIASAQKQLNQLLSQRETTVGVSKQKKSSKRKYTKRDKEFWSV